MEYYSEVDYNLAPKGKRFLNYIIDAIATYVFIVMALPVIIGLRVIIDSFIYSGDGKLLG